MSNISTFFHGKLSPYDLTCLKSFADFGHIISFYSYDKVICPNFCKWVDASKVADPAKIYYYQGGPGKGQISAFANYFRYLLLDRFDTTWIDVDVICLTNKWPCADLIFGKEDNIFVNNAVLRLNNQKEILRDMIRVCELDQGHGEWGATGPKLLTRSLTQYDLIGHALSSDVFYPVHWSEADRTVDPAYYEYILSKTVRSAAVHLWSEMFRRKGINKFVRPAENSYLWQIALDHKTLHLFATTS
ncbi:hypothetical protein FVE89_22140 [Methylobacterium sp. 2A]|uniref:hypothetical protein n=1 Tax=Methylobacterium sp. 2A TaxID=2603816 RepID=UPI00135271B4|nr:hypothetical protein [Methylobacterium sp. 2A]MWV24633.1 hypothetical protein [Methylobacterium sp. 2A]